MAVQDNAKSEEITPQMIEAGRYVIAELHDLMPSMLARELAKQVFLAMLNARSASGEERE